MGMKVKLGDEYLRKLSRLEQGSLGLCKKAVYEGAGVVIKAIKKEIEALPEEPNRLLAPGERYNVVTRTQKEGLKDSFGLSPMQRDEAGVNTKVGCEGYIPGTASKKYPRGLPAPMLARSIDSGSSVRLKNPFVRRATNGSRKAAKAAMGETVDRETEKIFNEK